MQVDQQFVKNSQQPIWHQQPCHAQNHFAWIVSHSAQLETLQEGTCHRPVGLNDYNKKKNIQKDFRSTATNEKKFEQVS